LCQNFPAGAEQLSAQIEKVLYFQWFYAASKVGIVEAKEKVLEPT